MKPTTRHPDGGDKQVVVLMLVVDHDEAMAFSEAIALKRFGGHVGLELTNAAGRKFDLSDAISELAVSQPIDKMEAELRKMMAEEEATANAGNHNGNHTNNIAEPVGYL